MKIEIFNIVVTIDKKDDKMRPFDKNFRKYIICYARCDGYGSDSDDSLYDEDANYGVCPESISLNPNEFDYFELINNIRGNNNSKKIIIRYMLWAGATDEETYDKELVDEYYKEIMDYPGMGGPGFRLVKEYPPLG
jgi:hypothetical protein